MVITLTEPNGAFLAELASFNMVLGCKAYAESMTEDEYIMHPIGTGAYMLKEWNHGNYVLLEKNPNYRNADKAAAWNKRWRRIRCREHENACHNRCI